MKKFLSLVLALVMTMSLVTISAGAKEFTDDDKITYEEAVDVISTIGVVDGDTNGAFRPTDTLTRQAAAKIICNLILGPTTAAELHADTAPYRDVPTGNQFAGYIAYCQQRGIISGYSDGTFRPTGTLTGYAFMKMLLGALGYDSNLEGYVGDNWSINVAKQALGIKLTKGLEGEFNGLKAVSREEACLYAFRTIQADLVEYGQRVTTVVNGQEIILSTGGAKSRTWGSQATKYDYIRNDGLVQFAEEYFNKLEKKVGEDEFERPAYTWIYDKEEIGTYVDWELMVAEYDDAVTGRELYDKIGSALLKDEDMDLTYYVNGVEPATGCNLPNYVLDAVATPYDGSGNITKTNGVLQRSNQNDAGFSGRGVLTQVFIDKEVREEIIITSIDTWMSKATSDYNENKETVPMDVWTSEGSNPDRNWNVDVEDVPEIADVKEDQFYLMQISYKDNVQGDVISIWEPEILEDSAVTKFSTESGHVPTKATTSGTEYKLSQRGYYDPDALNDYDQSLLTDRKYNIFLDQFGNMIGIELSEGDAKYVFIAGFDRPRSNLTVQTANASAIFLDGTMQVIKVNVTDTDKKIAAARSAGGDASEYFIPWGALTQTLGQDGFHALNRWFTYSVNESGVYTLKPATRMVAYKNSADETIKTSNLYLDDNVMDPAKYPYQGVRSQGVPGGYTDQMAPGGAKYSNLNSTGARAYGNDDSVYITVETDNVDTWNTVPGSISGVTGVYTGVQNVEIELDISDIQADRPIDEAYIYAVYDSDNYIVGAVTVGEGKGNNATIAYITDGVKSERREGDTYYWEFEAIIGGEVKTLTAKSKFDAIFTDVIKKEADASHEDIVKGLSIAADTRNWNQYDGIVELRFDADDYVVSAKPVLEKDIYSYYGYKSGATVVKGDQSETNSATGAWRANSDHLDLKDAKAYRINGINDNMVSAGKTAWEDTSTHKFHHYDSAPNELTLVGRTLYVTSDKTDEGLALASDAKSVVIQRENGKWKTREFSSVRAGLSQIVDHDYSTPGLQYTGEVVAVMNNGVASWVVFTSYENLVSGGNWTPTYGLTNVLFTNMTATTVDYTLVGTNAGRNYTVNLLTWNEYTGNWDVYTSWTVTGAAGSTSVAGHVIGSVATSRRYRLSCEGLMSANTYST